MTPARRWVAIRANTARRVVLGQAMRFSRAGGDASALLDRLPQASLLPLRRHGNDPVPALTALSTADPVTRLKLPLGLRGWLVTGYDEVRQVLAAGPDTMSTDFANLVGPGGAGAEQDPGGLGFADPPRHTRLRKLLAPHFTERAVARLRPDIERVVAESLDEIERRAGDAGTVDLHELFAVPIPSRVIADLLGIDDADRGRFDHLVASRFDVTGGGGQALAVAGECVDLLRETVRRRRLEPGPGLIGTILREHGDDATDDELAGLFDGVLTGGVETTTSSLALGSSLLLQDATVLASVRAGDTDVEAFVDETLRYLTVVQVAFPRFVRQDVTVGGRELYPGDVVVCSLAAANRDPRVGADADRIAPAVDRPPHVAFGHGAHRCVGAGLARLELRIALPALVRRFPSLALAVDPGDLAYKPLSIVHGVEALPVVPGAAR